MTNRAQGRLRLYLGAAPGVGKTHAMLNEAHRRSARGTDVVVGLVESRGRLGVMEMLEGLPAVPPKVAGPGLFELELDTVLERHPDVVLVDDLAHTNAPGSGNAKGWQDVARLLDAGIDVISTLNIEHLESLTDVVESITGVKQLDTVPDHVVRGADQIQLVDMTRKRCGAGLPTATSLPRRGRCRVLPVLSRRQPGRFAS